MGETQRDDEGHVTCDDLQHDREVVEMLAAADRQMKAIGYTEHGMRHARIAADNAGMILSKLERYDERDIELAKIAGLLHDVGNLVSREQHSISSALLSYDLLRERGMPLAEVVQVVAAVGAHDEELVAEPTSDIGAAVIIGDKADVARERVRNPHMAAFDIHDRINYAAEDTTLEVCPETRTICLEMSIDTEIGSVMEYFEIFLSRMVISRRSARMLGCDFRLVINDVPLL